MPPESLYSAMRPAGKVIGLTLTRFDSIPYYVLRSRQFGVIYGYMYVCLYVCTSVRKSVKENHSGACLIDGP